MKRLKYAMRWWNEGNRNRNRDFGADILQWAVETKTSDAIGEGGMGKTFVQNEIYQISHLQRGRPFIIYMGRSTVWWA